MALGGTVALGSTAAIPSGEAASTANSPTTSNSPPSPAVHVFGSDMLRVGLIGCGARGKGAAIEAIQTATGGLSTNSGGEIKLVAMADAFANNLQTAYRTIKGRCSDHVDVGNRRFIGLDGWRGVLASDVDLVILATPPAFRPLHLEAAIAAGKHVFMEFPAAVDMPGLHRVAAAGQLARQRGLSIAVGLQRRHEARTRDCVERLHDGMIGDLVYARSYTNIAPCTRTSAPQAMPDLEYQLRNWQSFAWAGGDFIDERHLHSLDCLNWVLQQTPLSAQGFAGFSAITNDCTEVRQGDLTATSKRSIDHQLIEFAYADEFRAICQCTTSRGTGRQTGEHFHGTLGTCDLSHAMIRDLRGRVIWQSEAKEIAGKGWQRQFNELIAALREGKRVDDIEQAVNSTTTAILGRMAVGSGSPTTWNDAIASELSFADENLLRVS